MKKRILRVFLLICGLNLFTACYGMPPEYWTEQTPIPEDQGQTKAGKTTDYDESDGNIIINPVQVCNTDNTEK